MTDKGNKGRDPDNCMADSFAENRAARIVNDAKCEVKSQPTALALPLAEPLLGLLRFFRTNQSIAVQIQLAKLIHCSEKLAGRYVAVVVAVHLAEPQRAAHRARRPARRSVAGERRRLGVPLLAIT